MPKVEVQKVGNHENSAPSMTLHIVFTDPARRVYLGMVTNEEYEALRVHFVSEFLAQPPEKTYAELDTVYKDVE